jgi:hypothetical protein
MGSKHTYNAVCFEGIVMVAVYNSDVIYGNFQALGTCA